MTKRLSDAQRDRIADLLRKRLLTQKQIARRFNVHESTINKIAKEVGVARNSSPWTEEEHDILRERYELEGPRGLARVLGRSPSAICRRAKMLGLSTRVTAYGRLRKEKTDD